MTVKAPIVDGELNLDTPKHGKITGAIELPGPIISGGLTGGLTFELLGPGDEVPQNAMAIATYSLDENHVVTLYFGPGEVVEKIRRFAGRDYNREKVLVIRSRW